MSGPGFAPPDLCSIRTAHEQEKLAEAVRGGRFWLSLTTFSRLGSSGYAYGAVVLPEVSSSSERHRRRRTS